MKRSLFVITAVILLFAVFQIPVSADGDYDFGFEAKTDITEYSEGNVFYIEYAFRNYTEKNVGVIDYKLEFDPAKIEIVEAGTSFSERLAVPYKNEMIEIIVKNPDEENSAFSWAVCVFDESAVLKNDDDVILRVGFKVLSADPTAVFFNPLVCTDYDLKQIYAQELSVGLPDTDSVNRLSIDKQENGWLLPVMITASVLVIAACAVVTIFFIRKRKDEKVLHG